MTPTASPQPAHGVCGLLSAKAPHWLRRLLRRPTRFPVDGLSPYAGRIDGQLPRILAAVRPFTMTSDARLIALCRSVEEVERRRIAGAIVECGVWRGGSMMAAALTLAQLKATKRELFLFDTFTGMTPPGVDDLDWQGRSAASLLCDAEQGERVCAAAALEEVRANLRGVGYPPERLHFVAGDVCRTLPSQAPERIALLRLDTDWQDSTYHELVHLYPRLAPGGILIVDDYGHWQGARRAVDRFLSENAIDAMLHVIDFTGRLLICPRK